LGLANAYFKLNQDAQAVTALRNCVKMKSPQFEPAAWTLLGSYYARQKNWTAARRALKQTLTRYPQAPSVRTAHSLLKHIDGITSWKK